MNKWENPFNDALYSGNAGRYEINLKELKKFLFNEIQTTEQDNPMSRKFFNLEDAHGWPSHNKKGERSLVDVKNLYFQNQNYFRCSESNVKETPGTVDIIFSGCSFTFGIGVPEECIWGSSLSKKMQMSYQNISMPGASVDWIIDSTISYIREHNKPKFIFCLFPNFSRMTFAVNPNKNYCVSSTNKKDDKSIRLVEVQLGDQDRDYKKGKYQKSPFIVNDIIPQELAYSISIRKILFLEQYCKDAGIRLFWSTWDGELEKLLTHIQKTFKGYNNFIPINNQNWEKDKDSNEFFTESHDKKTDKPLCHMDLKDKYPDLFYRGGDIEVDTSLSHFGSHRHEHIAETFFKKAKETK